MPEHTLVRRLALVLVVFGLYLGAWRPVRAWIGREVAHPVLAWATSGPPEADAVRVEKNGLRLIVPTSSARGSLSYHAPGGILLLFGAAVLAAAFPRRTYGVWLWGFHVAYGILCLGVLALTLRGFDVLAPAYRFLDTYGIRVLGLFVPFFILVRYDALPVMHAARPDEHAGTPLSG